MYRSFLRRYMCRFNARRYRRSRTIVLSNRDRRIGRLSVVDQFDTDQRNRGRNDDGQYHDCLSNGRCSDEHGQRPVSLTPLHRLRLTSHSITSPLEGRKPVENRAFSGSI
jgi:hypothetical protein